jgi:hypothetical protein
MNTGTQYVEGAAFQVIEIGNVNVIIDTDNFERFSKLQWHIDAYGYVRTGKAGERMHYMVLGIVPRYGIDVHHKNNSTTDNRRDNLELLSRSDHLITRPKQSNNSSGYKGVYYKTGQGNRQSKWVAQIGAGRQRIHIGRFDSAEAAARAYDLKALEFYGAVATLNFPELKCQYLSPTNTPR